MSTSVTNCTFSSIVNWDGEALEAVNAVAKGLLNLTELFKAQGVECLLKVSTSELNKETSNPKKTSHS